MTAKNNLLYPTPIADLVPFRPTLVQGVVVHYGPVYGGWRLERGLRRVLPARRVWLRDATGEIPLTLWGEEVGHVHDADRLLIVEAWVDRYDDRIELSLGCRGYLVNLGPANGRGPVWHPDPRGSLYVWGLVRRRLREKDLRARETRAAEERQMSRSVVPPVPLPESPQPVTALQGAP